MFILECPVCKGREFTEMINNPVNLFRTEYTFEGVVNRKRVNSKNEESDYMCVKCGYFSHAGKFNPKEVKLF